MQLFRAMDQWEQIGLQGIRQPEQDASENVW